ncbi:hypothetical protein D3C71_1568240 [compost metagenome]
MLRQAASTAATAPRRRTYSVPDPASQSCTQQLAFNGRGWPPQACSLRRASAWLHSKRSVASPGATGKTLRLTSVISPSVPQAPAIRRDTSYPATFFMTWPPKVSSSARPLSSVTPSM